MIGATMTEAQLLAAIRDLVAYDPRGLIYHTHDSRRSESGFPDLVIVGPFGVLFRELKSATGRPTPEQTRWIDGLSGVARALGIYGVRLADIWRPIDLHQRIPTELRRIGLTRIGVPGEDRHQ